MAEARYGEKHPKGDGGSMIADNVSGSFVITKCTSNGTLLVEGVAGTHLVGKTVEIFDGDGRKVEELGAVDADAKFSGSVGPPNPFKIGETVIVRIGPDVGRCTAAA